MKKIFLCIALMLLQPIIVNADTVILGGDSVGIVGEYDGLYISGTYAFEYNNKKYSNDAFIKPKDILISLENSSVDNIKSLHNIIKKHDGLNKLNAKVIRNNKLINTFLYTYCYDDKIQCGLYLKEKVQGIGTMTFYHPNHKTFACLGHFISEDNNEYLQNGSLYSSTIDKIHKANKNIPGEKIGNINFNNKIGLINNNQINGVYGTYISTNNNTYIETGEKEDLHTGKAIMYTNISNSTIQQFEITITKINESRFEFETSDPTLLDKCGGIIHGMSGSPIVQDKKLVGAVTHVLVNDPTRGYGIFIENMLDAAR